MDSARARGSSSFSFFAFFCFAVRERRAEWTRLRVFAFESAFNVLALVCSMCMYSGRCDLWGMRITLHARVYIYIGTGI